MSELQRQANAHRTEGSYEQAKTLYEQVLTEDPGNADAWWGLGHTVMNQGEFEAATEHFGQAVQIAPQNQRFLYDFAMLHTMLGQYEEARPLFERVVALDPTAKEAAGARQQLAYDQNSTH